MARRDARKSRLPEPAFFPCGGHSEAVRMADTSGVRSKLSSFSALRPGPVRAALLLVVLGASGCQTARETPRLATRWREAEVAVSNQTPHPWRLTLRSAEGEVVKAVEIRPRESLALVVDGGDYTIEQTLFAPGPAGPATRRFPGRLESGERYHWTLATLLSAEEVVAP